MEPTSLAYLNDVCSLISMLDTMGVPKRRATMGAGMSHKKAKNWLRKAM